MKFLFAFICLSNKYFSSVQLVFAQLYEEKLDFFSDYFFVYQKRVMDEKDRLVSGSVLHFVYFISNVFFD